MGADTSYILRTLSKRDLELRPLVAKHGAPDWKRTRNAFESLVRAIVGQQLSGKSAAAIYKRLLAHYGGGLPTAGIIAAQKPETLRGVGLSMAKARSVIDLAAFFADGRLSNRKLGRWGDDKIRENLLLVRGIGPWSVDMFLMFALNRPDVLPVGDLGVRKGMALHFKLRKLPEAAKMEKLARDWQPFRSYASWYMWRLTEEISQKNASKTAAIVREKAKASP